LENGTSAIILQSLCSLFLLPDKDCSETLGFPTFVEYDSLPSSTGKHGVFPTPFPFESKTQASLLPAANIRCALFAAGLGFEPR
jgi:hypothetical protein